VGYSRVKRRIQKLTGRKPSQIICNAEEASLTALLRSTVQFVAEVADDDVAQSFVAGSLS
jgi:hypothetical protein